MAGEVIELPICPHCNKVVNPNEADDEMGRLWHKECWRLVAVEYEKWLNNNPEPEETGK